MIRGHPEAKFELKLLMDQQAMGSKLRACTNGPLHGLLFCECEERGDAAIQGRQVLSWQPWIATPQ